MRPARSRALAGLGWLSLLSVPVVGLVVFVATERPQPREDAHRAHHASQVAPQRPRLRGQSVVAPRAVDPPDRTEASAPTQPWTPPLPDPAIPGIPDPAELALVAALRANPNDVESLQRLASCYDEREADEAVHDLASHCLAIEPDNARCASLQLRSSMRMGEFDRARGEVQDCLRLTPRGPTCLYGNSMLRAMDGDLDGAEQALAELREVSGASATMVRVLSATIARRRGDESTAVANLETACTDGQEWACRTLSEARGAPTDRDSMRRRSPMSVMLADL